MFQLWFFIKDKCFSLCLFSFKVTCNTAGEEVLGLVALPLKISSQQYIAVEVNEMTETTSSSAAGYHRCNYCWGADEK